MSKIPRKEILILIGDFNAKIGDTKNDSHIQAVVGNYELGRRNDRGRWLIQFCVDNDLAVMNIIFNQHKRRLYTWHSPDGRHRSQIDYILIRQRWRTSIKRVKTLPSTDCNTDHQLIMFVFTMKLKRCKRTEGTRFPTSVDDKTSFNITVKQKIK